jgi:hypothetical protein
MMLFIIISTPATTVDFLCNDIYISLTHEKFHYPVIFVLVILATVYTLLTWSGRQPNRASGFCFILLTTISIAGLLRILFYTNNFPRGYYVQRTLSDAELLVIKSCIASYGAGMFAYLLSVLKSKSPAP